VHPRPDADGYQGRGFPDGRPSDPGRRTGPPGDAARSDHPRPDSRTRADASLRVADTGPQGEADSRSAQAAAPAPQPAFPPVNARIEQLLVAAQRQIAEHARAAADGAAREAAKIRAAAESYAAGLRTSAEFEKAASRSDAEREAAKVKAAAEREREDIVRAARREADAIRRREQFLLEQSEALRSQAEADLDLELADRRAEAERLEVERLSDAQESTRKLVEEAERRAADAEKRATEATTQAEQARRDGEADAKKEMADAHRRAELLIAQAKDEGKRVTADLEADADKRRAAVQKELDELTRQKAEVDEQLAQMRQLFAVGTFLDTPGA
jgi:hypothetical protein